MSTLSQIAHDMLHPGWPAALSNRDLRLRRILWPLEARARRLTRDFLNGGRDIFPLEVDPADKKSLSDFGDKIFRSVEGAHPIGSLERNRLLLKIIGESFPSRVLTEAYFENLSILLAHEPPLPTPGKLVIGLGTGRSGSTSLAARLADVPGNCSTHENPPLVFWRPEPEQVSFHLRRFAILTRYYALVADAAHWWINIVDELVHEFASVKFIGLVRDKHDCAISFARIKGLGRGSYNHWAHHPNGLWSPAMWDPTYPKFDTPSWSDRDPDRAKWQMICRYLDCYGAKMAAVMEQFPGRFLQLRTEQLDDAAVVKSLYDFIDIVPLAAGKSVKLNVKTTRDGGVDKFRM